MYLEKTKPAGMLRMKADFGEKNSTCRHAQNEAGLWEGSMGPALWTLSMYSVIYHSNHNFNKNASI